MMMTNLDVLEPEQEMQLQLEQEYRLRRQRADRETVRCEMLKEYPGHADDLPTWVDEWELAVQLFDDPKVCISLAKKAWHAKDYKMAAAGLCRATVLQPDNWRAWYDLGDAYEQLGDEEAAAEAFFQAAQRDPGEGVPVYDVQKAWEELQPRLPPPGPVGPWLTPEEVAEWFRTTVDNVYKAVQKGHFPNSMYRLVGDDIRFFEAALQAYAQEPLNAATEGNAQLQQDNARLQQDNARLQQQIDQLQRLLPGVIEPSIPDYETGEKEGYGRRLLNEAKTARSPGGQQSRGYKTEETQPWSGLDIPPGLVRTGSPEGTETSSYRFSGGTCGTWKF
jgi:tetratricopeptide (TPR) repeat protein